MPQPGEALPLLIAPTAPLAPLPIAELFGRTAPLEVDVGCGKGRFLLARARAHPDTDFLGIDRMIVRLRKIHLQAARNALGNVRLLRLEAAYSIRYLLPPRSVSTFYVFFPDPWPKRRHHPRRLFGGAVVEDLARALAMGGRVHVATDHLDYFASVRALLRGAAALVEIEPFVPGADEQTDFERLFVAQGLPIGRCSFEKRADA
jgi:tRNA (guanine-N7-)-methyltransferase